jgi:hypothetical protein
MKKSLTRGSALVLAGGALALTGAILPAQAATSTGWRLSATFGVRANATILTSVDAVSARDAWATGLSAPTKGDNLQTLIKHWNGKSWANVVLPAKVARAWQKTDGFDGEVGATSPSDVWILGDTGSYLRLKGAHWSVGKLPGSSETSGDLVEVTSARVFSSANVWAFGTRLDLGTSSEPTGTPYAAHFNGRTWTATKLPAGVTGGVITAASATSSRSIWAVTGNPSGLTAGPGPSGPARPEVLHWTPAAGWTVPAQPVLPAGANLTSVLVEQNGHVLAGGSEKNSHKGTTPLAATWNSTAWTVAALPSSSTAKWTLTSLAADGRGAWAVAYATNRESSQVWRLSGSTWSLVKPAFGKRASVLLQLASVPHTSSAWGAGALKAGKSGALAMIAVAGPTPR